jgi:hypothetical protein
MKAVATYAFPNNDDIAYALKHTLEKESYTYLKSQKVIAAVSGHFQQKFWTSSFIQSEMKDILSKMSLQMDLDSLDDLCQTLTKAILTCAKEIPPPKKPACCTLL